MKIKVLEDNKVKQFLKKEWDAINKKNGVSWKKIKVNICILDNNIILGCSKFSVHGGLCLISQLIVKEDYRNKNLGKRLLDATEVYAKKKKCHKIGLTTSRLNGRALEFYLRNGYKIEVELENDIFHQRVYVLMKSL